MVESDCRVLTRIAENHHSWVELKGWHNKSQLEQLALIASEVGEAINECRGLTHTDKLGSELADIILRVMDMAVDSNIDIGDEIYKKMIINSENTKTNQNKLK